MTFIAIIASIFGALGIFNFVMALVVFHMMKKESEDSSVTLMFLFIAAGLIASLASVWLYVGVYTQ